MKENYCHCCGLPLGDYYPWGEDGLSPDYGICECCGIEYGYPDSTESALLRFRTNWLANGAKWWELKYKPTSWSLEKQLANLPVELPIGIKRNT